MTWDGMFHDPIPVMDPIKRPTLPTCRGPAERFDLRQMRVAPGLYPSFMPWGEF